MAKLREGLIGAQELTQSCRFAALMLLSGVSGAGKGGTVNRLLSWMDPTSMRGPSPEMRRTSNARALTCGGPHWLPDCMTSV